MPLSESNGPQVGKITYGKGSKKKVGRKPTIKKAVVKKITPKKGGK